MIKCSSPLEGHSGRGRTVSQDGKEYPSIPIGLGPYSVRKSLAHKVKVRVGQEVRVL